MQESFDYGKTRANALYKVYAKMLAPSHKTEVKSARYRA